MGPVTARPRMGSGLGFVSTLVFPGVFLEGEQLRFPPSNGRSAPCLPFSGIRPSTKGSHPLGTPLLCVKRKSENSLPLILRFSLPSIENPCPLSLLGASYPNLSPRLKFFAGVAGAGAVPPALAIKL